jgi:hypothetical protein
MITSGLHTETLCCGTVTLGEHGTVFSRAFHVSMRNHTNGHQSPWHAAQTISQAPHLSMSDEELLKRRASKWHSQPFGRVTSTNLRVVQPVCVCNDMNECLVPGMAS